MSRKRTRKGPPPQRNKARIERLKKLNMGVIRRESNLTEPVDAEWDEIEFPKPERQRELGAPSEPRSKS